MPRLPSSARMPPLLTVMICIGLIVTPPPLCSVNELIAAVIGMWSAALSTVFACCAMLSDVTYSVEASGRT